LAEGKIKLSGHDRASRLLATRVIKEEGKASVSPPHIRPAFRKVRERFWCKLLKGAVSGDNGWDDGTDLGTGSLQRATL
jgi:hypothetical protein